MRDSDLATLALILTPLSLAAFGSGMSVISEIQHQVVDVQGWMSSAHFLNLFAIARAAPGPGSMLVTLVGWHVAGWSGALVATIAMFLPSSILCAMLAVVWRRNREKPWLTLLERSLVPIGVGFLVAALVSLTHVASETPVAIAIGVVSAVICVFRPQVHPLALLGAGALVNVLIFLKVG
jgi:chromate transporter